MSVLESDLYFYGSANMPDGDGTTTGGALDTTKLIFFNDISPAGTMNYVSSSASDTAATITLSGRDSTGVIQTETKTFNGTTPVTGSQSFERLLKGVIAGTTAVGDLAAISNTAVISAHTAQAASAASGATAASITLQSGDGASVSVGQIIRITNNLPSGVQNQLRRIIRISGDIVYVNRAWGTVPSSASTYSIYEGMLFDLAPNQVTQIRRPFYNAAADVPGGSNRTYYEKIFAVNSNTTTALTVVVISKQVDPSSGTLQFALTNALNDTGTVANRQTAPVSGITSFSSGSSPQTINVPSPQNLPSGATPNAAGAQGMWLSLALTAGLAAAKTSFDIRVTGQTT
jgi:hypothetical protein